MALAECGCTQSLSFLLKIAQEHRESMMVDTALGDAIVRLSSLCGTGVSVLLELLRSRNLSLIDGAFRAMAKLPLSLTEKEISIIIDFAQSLPREEAIDNGLWFWVTVAAARWESSATETFLLRAANSRNEEIAKAAKASLRKESADYKIL
jgi:hypothetical protein